MCLGGFILFKKTTASLLGEIESLDYKVITNENKI